MTLYMEIPVVDESEGKRVIFEAERFFGKLPGAGPPPAATGELNEVDGQLIVSMRASFNEAKVGIGLNGATVTTIAGTAARRVNV